MYPLPPRPLLSVNVMSLTATEEQLRDMLAARRQGWDTELFEDWGPALRREELRARLAMFDLGLSYWQTSHGYEDDARQVHIIATVALWLGDVVKLEELASALGLEEGALGDGSGGADDAGDVEDEFGDGKFTRMFGRLLTGVVDLWLETGKLATVSLLPVDPYFVVTGAVVGVEERSPYRPYR